MRWKLPKQRWRPSTKESWNNSKIKRGASKQACQTTFLNAFFHFKVRFSSLHCLAAPIHYLQSSTNSATLVANEIGSSIGQKWPWSKEWKFKPLKCDSRKVTSLRSKNSNFNEYRKLPFWSTAPYCPSVPFTPINGVSVGVVLHIIIRVAHLVSAARRKMMMVLATLDWQIYYI